METRVSNQNWELNVNALVLEMNIIATILTLSQTPRPFLKDIFAHLYEDDFH